MLKFWAFIYRLTGWYSPWARLAGYKHLDTQWREIGRRYQDVENDMNLETHVALTVGCWEAEHGFTRTSKQVERKFKRKWKSGG